MTDAIMDTAAAPAATPAPEGNAIQQPQSVETPSDNSSDNTATRQTISSSEFSLPEEYKDKPWAEKIKSQEDAYKQIENLTALVGKKTIKPIDYETASAEDVAAYHKNILPENLEYKFNDNSMPEFIAPMSDIFKEAGIHPSQAKIVTEGFDKLVEQLAGKKLEADTSEEGYVSIMKESFGEQYKESVGIVENALKKFASNDDKKMFDTIDNTTRAAVDRTTHSIVKFYEERIVNILKEHGVTESGAQTEGGEGMNNVKSKAEQRSEIRAQMRELDGKMNAHEKIAELQKKLNKLL